jgi:hypothetical protein
MAKNWVLIWILSASFAQAQCRVCDEVVEFDAVLAQCFLQNFDAFHQSAQSNPTGRATIDMTECSDATGDAERGGLLTMPSLRLKRKPLKAVYVLDTPYLECLRALIDAHSGPLDPSVEFDLFEQCAQ